MTEDRALLAKALEALRDLMPRQQINYNSCVCHGCLMGAAGTDPSAIGHRDDCPAALILPLLSSTAAQEALRESEELLADHRRLDLLEREMKNDPLVLHDLLGLCGKRRTVRQAIDASFL